MYSKPLVFPFDAMKKDCMCFLGKREIGFCLIGPSTHAEVDDAMFHLPPLALE